MDRNQIKRLVLAYRFDLTAIGFCSPRARLQFTLDQLKGATSITNWEIQKHRGLALVRLLPPQFFGLGWSHEGERPNILPF